LELLKVPTVKEALVAHRRAKLTPLGRRLLVERVEVLGWPVRVAAESMGVSPATAYKWLGRFRTEGPAGLWDRSSRPHHSPRLAGSERVAQVLGLRAERRWGPHRIGYALGMARSSVYAILVRAGRSRLADIDRPTRQLVRYQRERPGELLHIDVKRLARIPDGGGHRLLGRQAGRPNQLRAGRSTDYLHAAVDDRTRLAYVEVHPDERADTCAAFATRAAAFFARHGVQIQEVMTDRALAYCRSHAFPAALRQIGARHLVIRPYRPQLNGKVERFNRTLLEEWAYQRLYRSNRERLASLAGWVDTHNRRRHHTALSGLTPMEALNNAHGNYT
jgi:transposase InsO family protein